MPITRHLSAAAALALLAASPANATLQIAAKFGAAPTFLCVDNNAACDLDGTTGRLQLVDQVLGGVEVNGSVQTSTGTVLTPGIAKINASSLSVTNTNATAIEFSVVVSDRNFIGPANRFAASGSGTWELADGSTINLGFYDDPLNRQGATTAGDAPGNLVATFGDIAVGDADSFAFSTSGAVVDGDHFGMSLLATGTLEASAALINRGATLLKRNVVSEPGSLALLGAALLGFVGLRRRSVTA